MSLHAVVAEATLNLAVYELFGKFEREKLTNCYGFVLPISVIVILQNRVSGKRWFQFQFAFPPFPNPITIIMPTYGSYCYY